MESKLAIGVNVDIQRTDGRIHSAVVSNINHGTDYVTVEWFEKDETKGKEVDLDAIYKLNCEYIPRDEPSKSESNKVKLQPKASRAINSAKHRKTNGPRELARPTTAVRSGLRSNLPKVDAPPLAAPPVLSSMPENMIGDGMDDAKKVQCRKSNCVKEVERIKQKREQRRAAVIKQKTEIECEYDIDCPNRDYQIMIREYRIGSEYTALTELKNYQSNHRITVCLRKRPLNKKELNRREMDVLTIPNESHVVVHEPKNKVDLTKYLENQSFRFDYSFDEKSSNAQIYMVTAKPMVEYIFERGMATCFAYGQTGSGKTHTMGGDFSTKGQQDCTSGIYAMSAKDVFLLNSSRYRSSDLVVGASFFEIYSGKVFDLLNKKIKLRVLEDGKGQVQIVGLSEKKVHNVTDVLDLIQHGNSARTSGTTSANNHSSRSHAVFQIILRKKLSNKIHGKFSLIDLAGNERGADTASSDRLTRMEGAEINKSLLALKECIRALGRNVLHLPFRASKLTQVLRDSFTGDRSRTCMIAMVSPGISSCEHTLNTLRYADRVKELGASPNAFNNPQAQPEVQSSFHEEVMDNSLSTQDSDLQMLINAQQDDNSYNADLINFHKVLNHMQEQEEQIIELHKTLLEQNTEFIKIDTKLVNMTDKVDYDMEEYAKKLHFCLLKKIDHAKVILDLKDRVEEFMRQIKQEEAISRNMKNSKSP